MEEAPQGVERARPRFFVTRPLSIDPREVTGDAIDVRVFGEDRPPSRDEIVEGARGCGALVTLVSDRVDGALLDALPEVRHVAQVAVGYDNVDVEACRARSVLVTHTPDVLTDEVADLSVGLLIATVRQLPQADRYLRAGGWLQRPYPLTPTLRGRTVGILGLGRIGKAIATRLQAFGLTIEYHGRRPQADAPYRYRPTLLELARSCDVLIVAASGGAETRHLVNAEVLAALGPQGVLINIGRGSVVDERALIDALREHRILAAGLDVFDDEPRVPAELIAMEQVVLLPHVASASEHTRNAMGQLVIDNLVAWFDGRGALTPVPECRELAARRRG